MLANDVDKRGFGCGVQVKNIPIVPGPAGQAGEEWGVHVVFRLVSSNPGFIILQYRQASDRLPTTSVCSAVGSPTQGWNNANFGPPRLRSCRSTDWFIGMMGVNHGDRGTALRIWSGDANANCPPDFAMFQNFKHQIACITIQ